MNVEIMLGSRDAKVHKPPSYAALLNSLTKNTLMNKCVVHDRLAFHCAGLQKLSRGDWWEGRVGGGEAKWQAVQQIQEQPRGRSGLE